MNTSVKRWGNSAAVRIPAHVLADAGLDIDQPVAIREERGRIIIEPIRTKTFTLDDLVRGISRENLHEPVDTGSQTGREGW